MKDPNEAAMHAQNGTKDKGTLVLVFKTNIETVADHDKCLSLLQTLPGLVKCSLNLEDSDRVLRIECLTNRTAEVIRMVKELGYHCEELAD